MSEKMKKQGNDIESDENIFAEKFSKEESNLIPQLESSAQFSLSVLEVSNSVNYLNNSTEQMKSLMSKTGTSTDSLDRQIAVRCAREMREAIKAKLEIARFVLKAGAIKKDERVKH